ncbi:MAG: 30S ribosomal protein S20 [Holosporaceae bacterium]|jgi:small subunit ribosomal protein S20|nr:30S ribosomal protein S20 [Holosporaceae bacterium]
MANHKSAFKRIKQNAKKADRNVDRISRIRTFIKRFMTSLGAGDGSAALSSAQSEIQKGVTKGVIHKNTAARKISRLSKKLKAAGAK